MKFTAQGRWHLVFSLLAMTSVSTFACSQNGSFSTSTAPVVRVKPSATTLNSTQGKVLGNSAQGEVLSTSNVAIKEAQPSSVPNSEKVLVPSAPSKSANSERLNISWKPWPTDPPEACAARAQPYRVLILDLKSGWFAGDGAGYFRDFLQSGILQTTCKPNLEITYAHITKSKIETNFSDPALATALFPCLKGAYTGHDSGNIDCVLGDVTKYDQVWVLSGSVTDSEDLVFESDFYSSIKARLVELKASKATSSFFFGAGVGNTDHSNDLAKYVFPDLLGQSGPYAGKIFVNNSESRVATLPNQKWGVDYKPGNVKAGVGKGTFLSTFPAFKNLPEIFDYAHEPHTYNNVALGMCLTDPIVALYAQEIIQDHCGQTAAAAAQFESHKVYLEGNTARFYGAVPSASSGQKGDIEYFLRIVSALM